MMESPRMRASDFVSLGLTLAALAPYVAVVILVPWACRRWGA